MSRSRSLFTTMLALGLLSLAPARPALAGPTCTTSGPIAIPNGMPKLSVAGADADGDGLIDQAEDELASCAVPIFRFDSGEPALESFEPVVLHSVFPNGFAGDGSLKITIRFAELYALDGGYVFCNFPEPNGCNSHVGDSQGRTLELIVEALDTAVIQDPPADVDSGAPTFQGTHLVVFPSWGKHHGYYSTLVCPSHDLGSCDCDACGLGHWDRANGNGPERHPVSHNVGQEEYLGAQAQPLDICSLPATTPKGFVNDLGPLGYPGELVYDPCEDTCNNDETCADDDPGFTAFFGDDSDVNSVHGVAVRSFSKPTLFVREVGGTCTYGSSASGPDSDGDGVADACDSCPLTKNPTQTLPKLDTDGDGFGDGCDNCPLLANPDQWDFDADTVGNVCDNCLSQPNVDQLDTDGDDKGDVCDNDDDGDGCKDEVDQHPKDDEVVIGSYFSLFCNPKSGPVYGYEGDNTDKDRLRNCQDADDDNDGMPDEFDPCPVSDVQSCSFFKDCPAQPWYDVCLDGDCIEYLLEVVSNPDPTKKVVFERFWIARGKLYVAPPAGKTLKQAARALALGARPGNRSKESLRMEIWSKPTRSAPSRLLALVAEYSPAQLSIGSLRGAALLEITPQATGAPLLVKGASQSDAQSAE